MGRHFISFKVIYCHPRCGVIYTGLKKSPSHSRPPTLIRGTTPSLRCFVQWFSHGIPQMRAMAGNLKIR
ncbi:hypothetical protein I7I53_09982 [Histoplasma capsulatum var. duboisii H88]|uniref:Uncharacterized protein n=1 Tax=Ajellomyces capsulatus (strain H88) TaxID=544711 RepID=A0A8A1LAW9_AJEC8|nr:hypothetical protein I7I53_09982 [Histoplasma capsulatum var. duboisii H88]